MSQLFLNDQEKIYQLALSLIKGVGFSIWKKLIDRFGSAQPLFHSTASELKRVLKGIPDPVIQAISQRSTFSIAEQIINDHQKRNIQSLSFFDTSYPERLRHIGKPPSFLYCQGNIQFDTPKVISIVGTRNATIYGKQAVENLIAALSEYQIIIVSGLAYGIDIHAHKLALKHHLPTVGVLASGLDIIYPAAHTDTALEMLDNGGLVSEAPVGSLLESFQFPHRNRLIAGLADVTIVIEADRKSGAVITANFANAYNREVFAVPGNIYEPFSSGCNYLIKTQQAHLLTSMDDIAYIMNWPKATQGRQAVQLNMARFPDLSQEERGAVQALKLFQKEVHIDELSEQTRLSPARLSPILLQLELKNVVQFLPGSKFKLSAF